MKLIMKSNFSRDEIIIKYYNSKLNISKYIFNFILKFYCIFNLKTCFIIKILFINSLFFQYILIGKCKYTVI